MSFQLHVLRPNKHRRAQPTARAEAAATTLERKRWIKENGVPHAENSGVPKRFGKRIITTKAVDKTLRRDRTIAVKQGLKKILDYIRAQKRKSKATRKERGDGSVASTTPRPPRARFNEFEQMMFDGETTQAYFALGRDLRRSVWQTFVTDQYQEFNVRDEIGRLFEKVMAIQPRLPHGTVLDPSHPSNNLPRRAPKRIPDTPPVPAFKTSPDVYPAPAGDSTVAPDLSSQASKTTPDFRHPAQWYPEARALQRQIHVHVGPTNSGKTYHALKRLQESESGVFAGPLRMLAHEVYDRVKATGRECALLTGDDRRVADDPDATPLISCTLEMAPLDQDFDVAVIDEIQMLNDDERGFAWTKAFLGLRAKELHVCGEARAVPIIEELAASCGDTVHLHQYERLTPLKMMGKTVSARPGDLRKGDCIVAFSAKVLFELKDEVEQSTGRRCAIIYGSLPPEVRAEQARLFNESDNEYDFLVATNAIGMGLNLGIKRMIFHGHRRPSGDGTNVELSIADIKQIAGRAGRFSTAANDSRAIADASSTMVPSNRTPGLVTTLHRADYATIDRAMHSEPAPIATAGILPADSATELFVRSLPPDISLADGLDRFAKYCESNKRLHVCKFADQKLVANALEHMDGLTVADRLILAMCPLDPTSEYDMPFLRAFATLVSESRPASVVDIPELRLELLDVKPEGDRVYLNRLQDLHKALISFLWLSYKFEGIFLNRELAHHVKGLVERHLAKTLEAFSKSRAQHRQYMERKAFSTLMDALGEPELRTMKQLERNANAKRGATLPARSKTRRSVSLV